uniref:DnaJ homolog subfamily A member 2 n=1 Tax=Cacopsylla melanoneura TaxID=428564 RepID=A0A8D8T5K5_9HEMI
MLHGQKILFTGEGDQEPGLQPGDIVIQLHEQAPPIFKRNGKLKEATMVIFCLPDYLNFIFTVIFLKIFSNKIEEKRIYCLISYENTYLRYKLIAQLSNCILYYIFYNVASFILPDWLRYCKKGGLMPMMVLYNLYHPTHF